MVGPPRPRVDLGLDRSASTDDGKVDARQGRSLTSSSFPSLTFLQSNLTLYTVTALLILDTDGNRILAKYYHPPHAEASPHLAGAGAIAGVTPHIGGPAGLSTLKEQKAFEKSVWEKTKRGGGEF